MQKVAGSNPADRSKFMPIVAVRIKPAMRAFRAGEYSNGEPLHAAAVGPKFLS